MKSWPAIILLSALLLLLTKAVHADDNQLAHRLYLQGRHAEAAEIFTDPAWKGAALYRSSQWWRAAEAFVRADDIESRYNLGNSYVQLGYYALALEAYQAVLAQQPEHTDALHNANVMRKLLAEDDDNESQQGLSPTSQEAIDTIESNQDDDAGAGDRNDEDGAGSENSSASAEQGDNPSEQTPAAEPGNSGAGAEDGEVPASASGTAEVSGQADDTKARDQPSTGSESDTATSTSQAAGMRTTLEAEQATEQWLNRINHDPQQFLQRRISLELNRRQAAGQAAPEGGSTW